VVDWANYSECDRDSHSASYGARHLEHGCHKVVLGVGLIVAGAIIGLIGAFKMDAPLLASETARSNLQKKPIDYQIT